MRRGEGQLRALRRRKDIVRRWFGGKTNKTRIGENARQINLSFSSSRSSLSSCQPHSRASLPSYLQPSTFFSYIDTIPELPRHHRAHTCVIRTRVPGKENVFRGSSHQLATTFRIYRTPLFQGLLPAFPEIFQCLIRRARLSNFGPPSRAAHFV